MSKTSFVIRLGPQWRAFAHERDGMRFFGIVQRGAAGVGALAKTDDGCYVQVNGDFVEVLNPRRVRRALRMPRDKTEGRCAAQPLSDRLIADAPRGAGAISASGNTPPASAPGPVITVKKRLVAVPATTDAASASERAGVDPAS